ncbi:hypothetical protein [Azospirillum canadense]|nr:hypothetical protein [Azospirillum canadense]MCW2239572.1 hypothetical protein [Azospirillum canadense]
MAASKLASATGGTGPRRTGGAVAAGRLAAAETDERATAQTRQTRCTP